MPEDQIGGDDAVSVRLQALVERLEARFGDRLEVRTQAIDGYPIAIVYLLPRNPRACGMSWINMGPNELIIEVGHGGRWEENRDLAAADFLESLVAAVTEGHVVEVFGPGRAQITVMLSDGTTKRSSVASAPTGCLPAPLWPRWGRRVTYLPYL